MGGVKAGCMAALEKHDRRLTGWLAAGWVALGVADQ